MLPYLRKIRKMKHTRGLIFVGALHNTINIGKMVQRFDSFKMKYKRNYRSTILKYQDGNID